MATLRDDLLPVVDIAARQLIDDLGFRTNSLTIRTKTWTGRPGATGSTSSNSNLTLSPKPKIRGVSGREVAASGGHYSEGDLRVGPITPAYSGGGYTPAQLHPTTASGDVEFIYIVTGPEAGEYELVDSSFDRALGYMLVIRRKRTTP